MRHDGRQQQDNRFQHFAGDDLAVFAGGVGFVVLVQQLHHGGDSGVELLAAVVIVRYFGDGAVQLEA